MQEVDEIRPRERPVRSGWTPGPRGQQSFYVAEPEAWSLVVEHRLWSTLLGSVQGQEIPGSLRAGAGPGPMKAIDYVFAATPAPAALGAAAAGDRRVLLPLADLLAAANVSLDRPCRDCDTYGVHGEAALLRRVGAEVTLDPA